MIGSRVVRSILIGIALASVAATVACGTTAAPQPTSAPAPKPAAQPTIPAAPTKVAAEPTKPAAAPTQPATAPTKAAVTIELRAGTSNAQGHLLSNAMDKFAELVKQKTNGEVTVRNFYQSLGTEQQLAQVVMSGSVDVGMLSNGNASRFSDAWVVYDLPFLFKSYDNMLKVVDSSIGKETITRFEKDTGLKMLWAGSLGIGRDIQTRNKQLKVPADIRGMKIRVVSAPVDLAIFKAWGANPTPLDWAQTFSGLQQGVVEGTQIVIPTMLVDKIYEVCKYNLRIDYQSVFQAYFINAKKLESLSPQQQKAVLEAAEDARKWNWKDASDQIAGNIEELKTKHGVQIYTPSPEEYAQWTSVREKVWDEVAEQYKGKLDLSLAKKLYEAQ